MSTAQTPAPTVPKNWENRIVPGRKRVENAVNHAAFVKQDQGFKSACEAHNVSPTTRQASKWRRQRGKAWKLSHGATV
jgi:hypothetical protein